MRRYTRHLMVACTTALVLAAVAGTASANRLSISSTAFTLRSTSLTFGGGGLSIICEVSLAGSFHSRTIVKTRNLLIGYINRGEVIAGSCNAGSARILQETLPWHVLYLGFTGTLPNIRTLILSLRTTSFLISFLGTACLFGEGGTAETQAAGIASVNERGEITTLRSDETKVFPLVRRLSGIINCPTSGNLTGSFALTPTLTVRLI